MGNRVAEDCLVFVYSDGMVTEKRCCAGFIYFTRRNHQDELDNVFLYGFKTEAVEIKKQVSGSQSSSLVAVHERVVFSTPNR